MGLIDFANDPRNDSEQVGKSAFMLIFLPFVLGYFLVKNYLKKNPFIIKKFNTTYRLKLFITVTCVNIIIGVFLHLMTQNSHWIFKIYYLVPLTLESAAFTFLFAAFIFKKELHFGLSADILHNKLKNVNFCEDHLVDKENSPVGLSYGLESVCSLKTSYRNQHIMITGGSGLGKTSFSISLIRHDIFWNRPVIFIDPKGDQDDIEAIKHYARLYNREKDVMIFSLVDNNNFFYDPLYLGTPSSKAEKILQILNIEHDYYRSVADNILQIIFTIFEYRKERITLNRLEALLLSKERLHELFDEMMDILPNIKDESEKKSLLHKINAFKDLKQNDILGIQSKISSINNREARKKINPYDGLIEINLKEVISENKIIIFDIKAGQYAELAAAIGRFLMKDLFILGQEIQAKTFSHPHLFIPIYFDEFHSFVNESFASFISMARSANFGLTLMFQTIAGIDVINEQLRHQLNTNTGYSVHFRGNASADLDFVAQTCGTEVKKENSNQIDQNSLFKRVTGMGTEFNAEVYRISPNLIRALDFGQCVIYKRNEKEIHVVESWHGKKEMSGARTKSDLNLIPKRSKQTQLYKKKRKIKSHQQQFIDSVSPSERVLYASYSEIIELNTLN